VQTSQGRVNTVKRERSHVRRLKRPGDPRHQMQYARDAGAPGTRAALM
jgi:hypothetical protein